MKIIIYLKQINRHLAILLFLSSIIFFGFLISPSASAISREAQCQQVMQDDARATCQQMLKAVAGAACSAGGALPSSSGKECIRAYEKEIGFIPGLDSREKVCNNLYKDKDKQTCLDKMNTEAFYKCIQVEESKRGQCADEFRNGNYAIFDPNAPRVHMPESESIASAIQNSDGNCNEDSLDADNCSIVGYIVIAIRVLSLTVGVVVVSMIIWGGILYTSSRDNPQQTAAAKEKIRNAIISLFMYIFVIAFLNWLVPGGVIF